MINIDSEGFLQEHVDNVPRQGWNRLREVDRFFWGRKFADLARL